MTYNTLRYEVAENILTLTLNRPDQLNAFTVEMANELIDAFNRASTDDEVRAIVVTGEGRAFCAGMDLSVEGNVFGLNEGLAPTMADMNERLDDPEIIEGVRDTGGRVTLAIYDCNKPVIAAINGAAVGVGAHQAHLRDGPVQLAGQEDSASGNGDRESHQAPLEAEAHGMPGVVVAPTSGLEDEWPGDLVDEAGVLHVEERFVLVTLPSNALTVLPTFHAPNAISFQAEAKLFVPMFLFFGKEDECPPAVATCPFEVEVMGDGHSGRGLPREIRGDCRVWDPR